MMVGSADVINDGDRVPATSTGQPPYTTHYYGINGPHGTNPVTNQAYTDASSKAFSDGITVAGQGMFQWKVDIRLIDVTDGTATTLMVGEMSWYSAKYGTRYRSWLRGGEETSSSWCGAYVVGSRNITNPINSGLHATMTNNYSDVPMGSMHQGGCNFAFGDASVRFINESINMTTYRSLASRNGGEPIGDF